MNDFPRKGALDRPRLPRPRKFQVEASKTHVRRRDLVSACTVGTAAEREDGRET